MSIPIKRELLERLVEYADLAKCRNEYDLNRMLNTTQEARALLQTNGWTKIVPGKPETLPEKNRDVLVLFPRGDRAIGDWDGKYWNIGEYKLTTITAWQPLPEPLPKES